MTLDLEKFISNSIKTQAKIQHLNVSTKTVQKIPAVVKSAITSEYGDNYLLDADYVSFFWGAITKDEIKKLFNVVDKALGQSANRLTETDFKKISFDEDSSEEEAEVEDAEDSEELEFEDTAKDVETEDDDLDDNEEDGSDDSSEDDTLNKDDKIEQQVQTPKTSYFFLKITLK